MIDLAIIILNYNTKDLTLDAIKSILRKKWRVDVKIVVVDNASSDNSVSEIKKKFDNVEIIESKKNLGFSKGNNLGLRKFYKLSNYCLLLNSDTKVTEGSLDCLLDFANKGYSIASCKLLNPDRSFQPNAGRLPYIMPVFFWLSGLDDIFRKFLGLPSYQERDKRYYKAEMEAGWVSGSVMLIKSNVFERMGFFDNNIFMYGEDVDFCWRAKMSGFKVGWTNKAQIIHIGGASSEKAKYNQWIGEFKGLLYLYKKYFGTYARLGLKALIYIFILVRIFAFLFIGKPDFAKTYAKILLNI